MSRYEQIAADLRSRIEAGELAPGDRVSSTREITKQWGVAMATATKALTELRNSGVVRAVPGVGTVVADTAGRADPADLPAAQRTAEPPAEVTLSPDRIVAGAVAVADAEGLAAVTMRRVATEIGAAPMSLYRHVADKDDLVLQMMDAAFGELSFPKHKPLGWRSQLELAARLFWQLCRRHPWLAPALSMTRPQPVPNAFPFTEWCLAAVDGHGLSLQDTFTTHLTVLYYVRGIAINLEPEAEAEARSGLNADEWMETQEPAVYGMVTDGRFPTLERMFSSDYPFDLDALFEYGLRLLLDGLAAKLSPEGPAGRR